MMVLRWIIAVLLWINAAILVCGATLDKSARAESYVATGGMVILYVIAGVALVSK